MTTTTFAHPDDDSTQDPAALLAELEYRQKRHVENMDGLRAHDVYLAGQIAHHDAEFAATTTALEHLPADATAGATYKAKLAVITAEFNAGEFAEHRAELQKELEATPKAIADNAKAIKAARAAL
jgi:hypothetical protein